MIGYAQMALHFNPVQTGSGAESARADFERL